MINVADYWPVPLVGHSISKVFDGGLRQVIAPADHGGAWLEEWLNDVWQDTWHYENTPRGILEDYDIYPHGKVQMVAGKEIAWGLQQQIGDIIKVQCAIKPEWPLSPQYGWQRVQFVALLPTFTTPAGTFHNVLELEYWQYWTSMGPSGGMISKGAKIWLAWGVGFLKQEWTKNGVPTGCGATLQSFVVK